MAWNTKIPHLRRFVLQNFPFIEEDFDALTDYQLICKVVEFLNKVITSQNEVVDQMINVSADFVRLEVLFNQLKDFVDHYFDSLDVQAEINNKIDAMVEDGTFQELINNYLDDVFKGSVEVIFPLYGKDGTDTLGDCSIIKTKNKVIMIDTFLNDETCWNSIAQCLVDNNITKIDYFLVSHYDNDHYGNYQRLIYSGLIDNARIILPKAVVGNGINKTGSDIKNALELASLTYEEADNETIEVEDHVSMRLFNASAEDIQYYLDAGVTNYNNFSVCTEIVANGKKMLFTGDILDVAMNYIANTYIEENGYELLKDAHHGFVGQGSVDFTTKVAPKYVLVPCSAGMISANLGHRSPQLNMWSLTTPFIYSQGTQTEPVRFRIGFGETEVLSDTFATPDMGSDGTVIYKLNTNSSSCRTGSAAYPFVNLNEASALISKNNKNSINIDVELDQTDTTETYFNNFNSLQIDFKNHSVANNITFKKCKRLVLKNINLSSSIISIEDCPSVYITNFTSSNAVDGQISVIKSNVLFSGTITSTNATSCIKATHSVLEMNASTISFTQSGSGKLFKGWCNTLNFDNTGLTQAKTLKFATEFIDVQYLKQNSIGGLEELETLFEDADGVTTGTLKETINNYTKFKVTFIDKNNFRKEDTGIRAGNNNNLVVVSGLPYSDNTGAYTYYGTINVHGTSVDVTRGIEIDVAGDGNTVVTTGDFFKVLKVVGIV